ncbi:hypothetical protein BOSEA31B_10432 [Hyphomicrobiales bacterium]|nr:hypothetical protein BOSEA31B_10432 [Hyphomicrobiales bacterium]CAH1702114.1 hypothetical protein BOSEA1005_21813 [Hyphomicrobiales bacterium]CAI0346271.1 hypothetical protein BO1005MUT1_490083 [Hyphomicrobiales bacterium]
MTLDEKALEAATDAVCLSDQLSPKAIAASGERDAILRHARKHATAAITAYLQALGAEGWHGPFGYLVFPRGLDESHWWYSDDPVSDDGALCLPVFTKEDPFERAMLAAAGER